MSLPPDQFVQVGTVRARYWKVGTGDPVLLLHGVAHSLRVWEQTVEALARRCTVYALDLIGHGLTDKPATSYHISDLAKFVRDFMAKVGLARVHLVGHSLGGAIAMRFAASYPAQVDKLVLVAPAGFCHEIYLGFRLATLPILGEWLTRPDRTRLRRVSEGLMFDKTTVTDAFVEWQYEYNSLPGAQAAELSILRTHLNLRGVKPWVMEMFEREVRIYSAPVLLIWGENDQIVPLERSRPNIAKLQNATLHTIKYCGHQVMNEYPDEFNRVVLNYLSQ